MAQDSAIAEPASRGRISRIILFIVSLVLTLSTLPCISFTPKEVDRLNGGLSGLLRSTNFLGTMGTHLAWFLLLTFGLGLYPMLLAFQLSTVRRLFFRKGLRQVSWEYILSFPLMGLGFSLLLGIWPRAFERFCACLNLNTIPGGVLGQRLTSPTGCFTLFMNSTGSAFVAIALILIPAVIIWNADWKQPIQALLEYIRQRREASRKRREEAAAYAAQEHAVAAAAVTAPEPVRVQETPARPVQQPAASRTAPAPAKAPSVPPEQRKPYQFPPLSLLDASLDKQPVGNAKEIERNSAIIQRLLTEDFSIDAKVTNAVSGPQVTQYRIQPAPGVRLSRITGLESELMMELAAETIRIEAPIPGENCVGIEVPNIIRTPVSAHSLLQDKAWTETKDDLPLLLGKNISGKAITLDLARAPHLLIAGTTGSGKSVCMNLMMVSLLYRFGPDDLHLIMVDPKQGVEFGVYNTLPHLVVPVITEVTQVALVLGWACTEMERRYRVLKVAGVRDLKDFNSRPKSIVEQFDEDGNPLPDKMPRIVIVIDELADIMLSTDKKEVESCLAKLAAKSRAVGIHAIIATQRPDVKVITGTIKANFPVRIAFKVASQVDSQTILGCKGAEQLLGKGDMLFQPPNANGLLRLQCGMALDKEREEIVKFVSAQAPQNFDETVLRTVEQLPNGDDVPDDNIEAFEGGSATGRRPPANDEEALIQRAIDVILRDRRATISYIQRQLGIGYNKSATIIDILEKRGIIGPQIGNAPREILVTGKEAPSA